MPLLKNVPRNLLLFQLYGSIVLHVSDVANRAIVSHPECRLDHAHFRHCHRALKCKYANHKSSLLDWCSILRGRGIAGLKLGVHLGCHLVQIDSCLINRGCNVTHRSSALQRSGCGVAHRWCWRDALYHRSWRVTLQEMENCSPRQERARRSLPLPLERCTPPQETARHNLQELRGVFHDRCWHDVAFRWSRKYVHFHTCWRGIHCKS